MSSFSFCSSCARDKERLFNCDFIYFIELDFVFFCAFFRLFSLSEIQRWIVSFCDFLYVFFRFSFNYFSFIDCRLNHCEITISHYFFSMCLSNQYEMHSLKLMLLCQQSSLRRKNYSIHSFSTTTRTRILKIDCRQWETD
jgi:hypothetical protein